MSNQKSLESVLKSKINTINNKNIKKINNTSHIEESVIDNLSENNRLFT